MADERVSDRHFIQMRQRAEEREVPQVEIMSGVDAQTELVSERGGLDITPEARLGCRGPTLERPREWLGVELDAVRAHLSGPAHRRGGRIDKEADANAGRAK